ncbi:MAG: MarR family transcriptional regulator [Syntrophomonadaceae bacterium]|jgi:DNA-binding MarR family transcriptional regulator|nr:MarR family transcriptional regulator [Syntrophomonadaceae bacterium]NLX02841.1 MarR family transcriptional regulator [Syntrophomonadaceae bacterium]
MTDFYTYLCFSMRAVMKKIDRQLSSQLEPYGVSIPQSFVLTCLYDENGITLKEIGNRTLIDSSSMTVLVDKLEKDKLVERQLDPEDRRAIRVYITDKGQAIAEELVKIGAEFNAQLYDMLGEGNQKEFSHGIKNLLNGLE